MGRYGICLVANFFGFPPTYTDAFAPSINGDDAIELFCDGQVIDVFGNINQSGVGQPWEYTDGWAYRKNNTGPDNRFCHRQLALQRPQCPGPGDHQRQRQSACAHRNLYLQPRRICPNATFTQTITIDDTEAPVLECPSDITINLDPGACEAPFNFEVTATDNCDPNPVVARLLGCACNVFEIGENTLTFEATDINGNSVTCSFVIDVLEYPNPVTTLTSTTSCRYPSVPPALRCLDG